MDTIQQNYTPKHAAERFPTRTDPGYSAAAGHRIRVDVRCIVIANRAAGVDSPRHAKPES